MTPMRSRRSVLAGSAVVASCGLAGCLAGGRDVERPLTKTHTTDELTALAVSTVEGDVGVRPTARDTLTIDGQKAALSEGDLEEIALATTTDDGLLELAVERDDSRSVFGLRPDPVLDLTVGVPERLEVRRLETGTGAVDAAGVVGDIEVSTTSGHVRLADVDGTVSVDSESGALEVVDPASIDHLVTNSGDVAASLPGIDGDARIETTTGNVELRVPDRLDMTLEITTEAGEISVSGVEELPEMAGDSLIEAVVGDGTHRLEVATETGNVTVTGRE